MRDALRAEREVVEGGGGDFEAGGGGADVVEAVLEEIDLEICLLFEGLEVLYAHLLHLWNPNPCFRRHGSYSRCCYYPTSFSFCLGTSKEIETTTFGFCQSQLQNVRAHMKRRRFEACHFSLKSFAGWCNSINKCIYI